MATNYIQPGAILTLTAPYDRLSGEGAQVGSIFGVATSDVDSGDPGEFDTEGVRSLAKTSAQAWTVGQKIYWDDSNKRCDSDGTVGMLIGYATAAAANPSSTGDVKLNGSAPSSSEGPQAAEADLTDNSGGAAADGTIGVVTAPTALTDNGGGTADGTVASQAEPVTLTDSSGYDGTHDDTIAAMVAITTLTDNTSFSGTHDDTLAAVTVPADLTGGESPTEAEHNALLAVVRVIAQNQSDIGQKAIELVAREIVHAQNISDLTQKAIELVTLAGVAQDNLKEMTTRQAENRTAIVALTDAVKELSTKLNATLAKLRLAGVIST